jgi:hypothetical protein
LSIGGWEHAQILDMRNKHRSEHKKIVLWCAYNAIFSVWYCINENFFFIYHNFMVHACIVLIIIIFLCVHFTYLSLLLFYYFIIYCYCDSPRILLLCTFFFHFPFLPIASAFVCVMGCLTFFFLFTSSWRELSHTFHLREYFYWEAF